MVYPHDAVIRNIFHEFLGLIDRIQNPWENPHKIVNYQKQNIKEGTL